jgi:hypothetical protein
MDLGKNGPKKTDFRKKGPKKTDPRKNEPRKSEKTHPEKADPHPKKKKLIQCCTRGH